MLMFGQVQNPCEIWQVVTELFEGLGYMDYSGTPLLGHLP